LPSADSCWESSADGCMSAEIVLTSREVAWTSIEGSWTSGLAFESGSNSSSEGSLLSIEGSWTTSKWVSTTVKGDWTS